MKIQYLVTTYRKNKQEISDLLEKMNIHGEILVGNQVEFSNGDWEIITNNYFAHVYNHVSVGTSKNRNFLIKKSNCDYFIFMDDDVYFYDDVQNKAEQILFSQKHNCVMFNIKSENDNRPIQFIEKDLEIKKFRKISSRGVIGCYFKRSFLISNNLYFNEMLGPGTEINHGEDGVFFNNFLKLCPIYSSSFTPFYTFQSESVWLGRERNLDIELFSHGYLYYLLYKKYAKFMAVAFLATHMYCYPKKTSFFKLLRLMFDGIEKCKKSC